MPAIGTVGSIITNAPSAGTSIATVTIASGDVPSDGDLIMFAVMTQGQAFSGGPVATSGVVTATAGSESVIGSGVQRHLNLFYEPRSTWSGTTITAVYGGGSPRAWIKVIPFTVTKATGIGYTVSSADDNKAEIPSGTTFQQPPIPPDDPMTVPGPSALVMGLSVSGSTPTLSTPEGFTLAFSENVKAGMEANDVFLNLVVKRQTAGTVATPVFTSTLPELFGATSAWAAVTTAAYGPNGRRGLGLIR